MRFSGDWARPVLPFFMGMSRRMNAGITERCSNCKHWEKRSKRSGDCDKQCAQVYRETSENGWFVIPARTRKTDWCGMWECDEIQNQFSSCPSLFDFG